MESSQSLDSVYYVFSSNCLTLKELSIERSFIVWAAQLNQHVYYKGIMTSKFGSKDMMLWKRGSFVFTEDETLWIASRPIWHDRSHPPEKLP